MKSKFYNLIKKIDFKSLCANSTNKYHQYKPINTLNNMDVPVLSNYEQVGEFHQVFGHPLNTEQQINILNDNPKIVQFRLDLIKEELNEFIDACEKKDIIEAIDAIADTMYVVYGACHVFGIDFDKVKTCPETLYEIYEPCDIFEMRRDDLEIETNNFKNIVTELVNDCTVSKKFDEVVMSLDNIIKTCYTISSLFQVDIDKCFNEVHRSNMTKVCISEEEAIETVEWYKNNEKRYADPAYRKSINSKYWVVYDRETSKILKSIKFQLPNIASIVNKH
jgi:predicted HAD superfamily Cof-like phosphohydrolase